MGRFGEGTGGYFLVYPMALELLCPLQLSLLGSASLVNLHIDLCVTHSSGHITLWSEVP